MKHGFTLVEVLIAMFVITVGVGGVFSLVRQNTTVAHNANLQFKASFLSQEGLEIARNIRDANLLKIHAGQIANWNDNLTGCSPPTGCEVDYSGAQLDVSQERFLNIASNLYTYNAGTVTPFKRKIFITEPNADVVDVNVVVSWTNRGKPYQVKSATKLYNWISPTL